MKALQRMRRSSIARAVLVLLALLVAVLLVIGVRTVSAGRNDPVAAPSLPDLAIDMPRVAAHLAEAIRFQTVSVADQPESSQAQLEAFRTWLAATYPAFHAAAKLTVVGGGTLVFEWPGTQPTLKPVLLMAHQDVVPEIAAERWQHPPFGGVIADGSIWGRGAIDNKGALIAIMEAAEALVAGGHTPQRTLILVFGHNEEVAGSGAPAAAALLEASGVQAEFVLDEGSLLIEDHPVTGTPVALIGVSEKGYATVRVTARGAGGHASAPPDETAVGILAEAIEAITSRPFPSRYDGATRAMLESMAPDVPVLTRMAIANAWLFRPLLTQKLGASPQGAAMLHTTLAPTMLAGSPRENVLATEATATINLRIAPGDTVVSVLEHLRESVRDLPVTVELTGENFDPSTVSPTDSTGYRLISDVASAVFGVPVAPAPVIAATDSRSMSGLSRNIYRFQPVRMSLAEVSMIHGIDEHLGVEALEKMVRFYGALISP